MFENSSDDFPQVFEDSVKQVMYNILNTCIIGSIVSVDNYKKKKVTVQPEILKVFNDEQQLEYPLIKGVPLVMYGCNNVVIKLPKKELVGSKVVLFFSQRSIDTWLGTGEKGAPEDNKKFDLSDCVAFLGIDSFKEDNVVISEDDNFEIKYGDGSFIIQDDATINLNNGNFTVEL